MRASSKMAVAGLIFVAGFLVGHIAIASPLELDFSQKTEFFEHGTPYTFISPLLFCTDQNLSRDNVGDLKDRVQNVITEAKNNGDLIEASFYFRDLNGGPWSTINPEFHTMPASLLKVPLALSVYQRGEKDPKFLTREIISTGDTNANKNEHFQPRERIQPYTTYTINDLVRYMLEDSDNAAMYLLGNTFDVQELSDLYMHLGIKPPTSSGYSIDVKTYASFFRMLYNATYLNKEDSEHVLSLLSQSSFTQGIVSGVPKDTAVAHKFGEAVPGDGTARLNDCGIVYKPNQPYVLCIMTAGTDLDTLANFIGTISRIVYETLAEKS